MAPDTDPPVYAIYCRLSRKAKGRRRNDRETVERQEALCRKYAAEVGIAVADEHVYTDNHRSAWKTDGARPEWDRMMAAGQRREFDGLLAYKLDRFARNVRDAEDLVDLAGKRRVMIDGPHSGRIDLSSAHGRRTFREAAVQAAAESDNASERLRDALAERAAAGLLLGGGRLFGFEVLSRVREDEDDVEPRQRPDEVAIIREAARRMLAGESLTDIAADLNERGVTTTRGGKWTGGHLGNVLGAPRYGGYVVLNGEIVARTAGEPVFDADTYAEVQAARAKRRRGRRPTGLWPLTGVLRCGKCGDRAMAGHTSSRARADGTVPRYYVCSLTNGGCGMTILAEPVEELVKARVLADVNDADLVAGLGAETVALNDAMVAAAAEVDRLDGMLADLEVRRAEEQIRSHAYEAAKRVLDLRVLAAEAALEALGAPAPAGVVPVVTGGEWDVMSAAEKRTLIARLHLEITARPQRPGAARNVFDPRRVKIRP